MNRQLLVTLLPPVGEESVFWEQQLGGLHVIAKSSTNLVSFIIPVFQALDTIQRTLDCVAAQSHKSWEAIVVQDGEDQPTAELLARYAASDPRFIIISSAHVGVSKARNIGLSRATGEWVVFLDADDTISSSFLTKMVAVANDKDQPDCVVCGFERRSASGKVIAQIAAPPLESDALETCLEGPPAAIHCFLLKKASIDLVGGFDERLSAGEDWDLWLRLAESGVRFAVVHQPLAHYWSSEGSLSRSGTLLIDNFAKVHAFAAARRLGTDAGSDGEIPHDPQEIADKMLGHIFWSAGVAIGESGATSEISARVSPLADWRFQKEILTARIIDGIVVGSGYARQDHWKHWPVFSTALKRFLTEIGSQIGPDFDAFAIKTDIESEVVRAGTFRAPLQIGHVAGEPVGLRTLLRQTVPSDTADIIMFRLRWLRPSTIASFVAPNFGPMRPIEVVRTMKRVTSRRVTNLIWRFPRLSSAVLRVRRMIAMLRRLLFLNAPAVSGFHVPASGREAASRVQSRYFSKGASLPIAEIQQLPCYRAPPEHASDHPATGASAQEWDRFFETEDPWDYGNAYEQLKYQRTLDLISRKRARKALELACAEGRFTAYLAPHADDVTALDISNNALDRAARRNAGAANIRFGQSDFFADGIAGIYDLIICSEVLYYMPSVDSLTRFCSQVADALEDGGRFVHAHGFQVVDSPDRTAFDWDDSFGAATIFECLRTTETLHHVRSVITELYRIDVFEKHSDPSFGISPLIEEMPLQTELMPAVASSIVWNGAIRSRADASEERSYQIPVLMYHRIANDGPASLAEYRIDPDQFETQLRFLRRRGYHSVTTEEWRTAAQRGGSLRGRPIMITFDDAYQDFADTAWPILQRNGFGAHMFVPVGKIGEASDWDARYGNPAKIMDWQTVARLAGEGVGFGSHLVTHTAADLLPTPALLDEAIRSRITLEHVTGGPVRTVAPPFGINDNRIEQILVAAGYMHSFIADGGMAPVCGFEMRCPRIGIYASMTLEDFATAIGRDDEMPDGSDRT